jgi:hypothetical protein
MFTGTIEKIQYTTKQCWPGNIIRIQKKLKTLF